MSWAKAGDWLEVAGLALLTFGTGAQAVTELTEFRSLRKIASRETAKALAESAVKNLVWIPVGASVVPVLRPEEQTSRRWLIRRWRRSELRTAIRRLGAAVSYPGNI